MTRSEYAESVTRTPYAEVSRQRNGREATHVEIALIVVAVALVAVAGLIVWVVLRREGAATKEVDQRME
ncbi:MAG: hypothetical protein WBF55_08570, partial [Syntrophobacteria bacterium]